MTTPEEHLGRATRLAHYVLAEVLTSTVGLTDVDTSQTPHQARGALRRLRTGLSSTGDRAGHALVDTAVTALFDLDMAHVSSTAVRAQRAEVLLRSCCAQACARTDDPRRRLEWTLVAAGVTPRTARCAAAATLSGTRC